MKKLLLSLVALGLVACGSSEEKAEAPAPESVQVQEEPVAPPPAPTPVQESAPDPIVQQSVGQDFPDVTGGTLRGEAKCGGRRVAVYDTAEKHCGVHYEKEGFSGTVAYAKWDMGFCDQKMEQVKNNIGCSGAAAPATEPAKAE